MGSRSLPALRMGGAAAAAHPQAFTQAGCCLFFTLFAMEKKTITTTVNPDLSLSTIDIIIRFISVYFMRKKKACVEAVCREVQKLYFLCLPSQLFAGVSSPFLDVLGALAPCSPWLCAVRATAPG